jgi:hypothetical protein
LDDCSPTPPTPPVTALPPELAGTSLLRCPRSVFAPRLLSWRNVLHRLLLRVLRLCLSLQFYPRIVMVMEPPSCSRTLSSTTRLWAAGLGKLLRISRISRAGLAVPGFSVISWVFLAAPLLIFPGFPRISVFSSFDGIYGNLRGVSGDFPGLRRRGLLKMRYIMLYIMLNKRRYVQIF